MKKKETNPAPDMTELRRRAAERLKGKPKIQGLEADRDQRAVGETMRLVHELEVYQIELEMQNEELHQAKNETDAVLAQFTTLYDFAPIGYFTLTRDSGTIRQVNLPGARLFGMERSLLVNCRFDLFVSVSDISLFKAFLTKVFESRKKESCEVALRKEGDHLSYVQIEGIVSANDQECFVMVLDITERKRMEERLQKSEQLYRAIGESIDYGIWVCDTDGRNIYASKSFLDLVGFTQEQCSNFGWGNVLHPDDGERTIAAWKECVRTGGIWDIEHRYRGVDGKWHFILARGVPVRNEQGEIICWAGINLDISALKKAEISLKERTQQLEEANKELESFSYSISHDLRAPVRAIDGFSSMLMKTLDKTLDDEARRRFNIILESTKKMNHLIDDLLALSRIGRAAMTRKKIDMNKMTKSAWQQQLSINPDRTIVLKNGDLPDAFGDGSFIFQVLVNLLSNAVKYTGMRKDAVIEIGGEIKQLENIYYVKDNGVGFDMQYHDKLFGVFQRLHRMEDFEGTGVGLAIVERIIHRHGGRVWAEGEVDKGATFYFTLPQKID